MINFALIVLLLYIIKIFSYSKGWGRLPQFEDNKAVKLSIVVAFRNEAKYLPLLLADLKNQNYPKTHLEFIFVDDSSDDNSFDLIDSFPLKKILLKSPQAGKKSAIEFGIQHASSDVILTTDADCRVGTNWLIKMMAPFVDNDVQFVFGPVAYRPLTNLFDRFQALEFMSLIASGAGAVGNNKPFMCNAANMAFRKSIFKTTEHQIASGDDVFLLHHVKRNKGKIHFVKEQEAIVYTHPKSTLSDFINQRKRWASKSSSYKDKSALWSALLVFSTNLIFLYFILSFNIKALVLTYLIKSVTDYLFLKRVASFFELNKIIPLFWILQFIYPFYIVWVALSSQLNTYEWKGRSYKK